MDLFPREVDFFQIIENQYFTDAWNPNSFGGMYFHISLDTKLHNRSVYSILDFLGDVGGFLSILLTMGSWFIALVSLLSSSFLERHVVR